ncbi:purine-nucleoside phosphorylase [Saccharomycopsis crataegensis]|uniref:Purine nucleoside phosphorylase n=1 Tax=Saccharomycopsis crataegensis TaxID=43959 RepID=A0AAV5QRP7_9ASCO|nr:purine-nucleoside phosphorylase [Saccharomycopsis crataegensis]
MSTDTYIAKLNEALQTIKVKLPLDLSSPRVLIICGSGLGGIASKISSPLEIAYSDIPGFKVSTVAGHAGKLVFGTMGSNAVPVMCMVGRLHFYEGYEFNDTNFPVRLASLLGVSTMIVTNAAGGLNTGYKAGDLMIIDDHLNLPGLAGFHPLRGPNLEMFGPRFQPLSDAYSLKLRQLFFQKKLALNITRTIHEGTYVFAAGPTFESRAEVRMLRVLGGDAVGMSTVPEVIVGRHCGLEVLAVSLITNEGLGAKPASAFDKEPERLDKGMASHDEVLENANAASKDVQMLVSEVVNEL